MYSVSLLLLLAGANYPDGSQAASAGHLSRRQSTGTVELWGACNYPSQGINGPLPCVDGSECICKDDSKCRGLIHSHNFGAAMLKVKILLMTTTAYAQCRQQIDGSWAPDPSWQCQQPGSSPTGTLNSNTADQSNTSPNTSSGSNTSNGDSNQSSGGGGGSQAATIGDCTTASPPGGWDGVASTSVSA